MRSAVSYANRGMRLFVFAAAIATGVFATVGLQAMRDPGQGCCGKAESGTICDLDSALASCVVGQGGDAFCNDRNHDFPHCCDADGFCSGF